jgi:predicted nucleic acid-binding protein
VRLLLDTSVLGWVCHPRKHDDVRAWFRRAVLEHEMLVSEVADYELRRELLRIGAARSLARLDEVGRELVYVPVTTATWRSAARLWAQLRQSGVANAPREALDPDVLIAVQAVAEEAAVVTSNVDHFKAVVRAMKWEDVPAS